MNECDGHRAFADGGSATLHGAVANVARCKLSRDVGFQIVRIAVEGPVFNGFSIASEVSTGEQVAPSSR